MVDPGFPVGGTNYRHLKKFVCQNGRIGSLRWRADCPSMNPPMLMTTVVFDGLCRTVDSEDLAVVTTLLGSDTFLRKWLKY